MPIFVSAALLPRNSGTWFVLEDKYVKGGFQIQATVTARNAVPAGNLKHGMLCLTLDDGKLSQLQSDLVTWAEFTAIPSAHTHVAADITQDSSNRFVADTDIATWNGKQDALGFTAENSANKGQANGYAALDAAGKLPTAQLPDLALTDTYVVSTKADQLALTAHVGDVCVRTDLSKSFILKTAGASTLANWQELLTPNSYVASVGATAPLQNTGSTLAPILAIPPATASVDGYMSSTYAAKLDGIAAGATNFTLAPATSSVLGGVKQGANVSIAPDGTLSASGNVLSVAGKTGTVALVAGDVSGLSAVATTGAYGDLSGTPAAYSLPVATASVLGGVKDGAGVTIAGNGTVSANVTTVAGRIGDVVLTKSDVGLGNVDNTSDLNKPVSTATTAAITAAVTVTPTNTVELTNKTLTAPLVKATVDAAVVGSEILTADGTFTGSATGWTLGSGWAYGTNNVVCTLSSGVEGTLMHTASVPITAGQAYLVTWTQTNSIVGNCTLTPTFGVTGVPVAWYGTGATDLSQIIVANLTGLANLYFTVTDITSSGTVTVDNVSVKPISLVTPAAVVQDTAGTARTELRAINSSSGSTLCGVGSGSYLLSTSNFNVAFGQLALQYTTSGTNNTAIGYKTLNGNVTGIQNTAVGSQALQSNIGQGNTAVGYLSLASNIGGFSNTALGSYSMQINTQGQSNVGIGYLSLRYNTTGFYNVAVGVQSLLNVTTGNVNTAIGYSSLSNLLIGTYNVALGSYALGQLTTASTNVAVGDSAAFNTTTGRNTALGASSLYYNRTGSGNTAVGYTALQQVQGTNKQITAFADYSGTVAGTILATCANHGLTGTVTKTISGAINALSTINYNGTKSITVVDANTFYFTGTFAGNLTNNTAYWSTPGEGANNTAVGDGTGANITTGSGNTLLGANVNCLAAANNNILLGTGDGTTRAQFDGSGWIIQTATGSDMAIVGSELTTADGTFTGGTTGWTLGTGWAYGTNNVVCSIAAGIGQLTHTANIQSTAGQTYQISWAQQHSVIGNANITVGFGGVTSQAIQINSTNSTNVTVVVTATATGSSSLTMTANNLTATGTVTIDNISLKPIATIAPVLTAKDATYSTSRLEFRASASGNSTFGNTLVGTSSGLCLTSASSSNTALGDHALYSGISVTGNAAFGYYALAGLNSGNGNVAIGSEALRYNMSGAQTAVGYQALKWNVLGNMNTAIGAYALTNNINGVNNTALGYGALQSNVSSNHNTAIGYNALYAYNNTASGWNVAVGGSCMNTLTTGATNVAVGFNAMNQATSASANTALGYYALYGLTIGGGNVALGTYTAQNLISSNNGTYLGNTSGQSLKVGDNNTLVGYQAGINSVAALYNTVLGAASGLNLNATNKQIIAFADYSGTVAGTVLATSNAHGLTGTITRAIAGAPYSAYNGTKTITVVDSNTFYYIATFAGTTSAAYWYDNTQATYNTFIGTATGQNVTTGSNNTIIGSRVSAPTATVSNNILIGTGDGASRLTFDSNNWSIPSGNLKFASGAGIDFSAKTGAAGSTSKILNDYEEGTFTPTLSFSTPGDLVVAYNTQLGFYTKVGRKVTVTGRIQTSTFTWTTASGAPILAGLPFSPGVYAQSEGSILVYGWTKANFTNLIAVGTESNPYLTVYAMGSGQTSGQMVAADFPSGTMKIFSYTLTYFV